jgi:hypothetical protein
MPRVLTFKQALTEDKNGGRAVEAFVDEIQWHIDNDDTDSSFSELMNWAFPESWSLTFEQATKLALKAKSLTECHEILKRASAIGQKGRPSTKRVPAIKALVYRQCLGWNWPKITEQFCPCREDKHNSSCQESLRAEVGMLKRLLRKYGITFP